MHNDFGRCSCSRCPSVYYERKTTKESNSKTQRHEAYCIEIVEDYCQQLTLITQDFRQGSPQAFKHS